jgi:hypothetical protein
MKMIIDWEQTEDASEDGDMSRLHCKGEATLLDHTMNVHVELIQVANHTTKDGAEYQDCLSVYHDLDDLDAFVSIGGQLQTFDIDGREYILVVTPYAR